MLRKASFVVVFVLAVALAGTFSVVSAGGPYGRWLSSGAVIYTDPDPMADVSRTVTETVSISVTIGTGWAQVISPPELAGYVQTASLLREEPVGVKAQREQKALAAKRVGDMAWGELMVLLRQLLSGTQPATSPAAVPAVSQPATVSAATTTYVVQPGDSLSGIGAKLGVSWQDLAKANNIVAPWTISVGQVLTVPGSTAVAVAATTVVNPPTGFGLRDCLVVNDVKTCLEGQDVRDVRAMYHDETGIAKGQNYTVTVPKGWSLGIFGVSAEIVQEGGQPIQYTGGPALIIRGPWKGSIGAYEAGLHGVPSEWESYLSGQIFNVHKKYVPNAKLVYLP